jgi:LysR family transcriptional regulator of abg operon
MKLKHLEMIIALAEAGSLRAAAQVLHVTQPALTKALRQLEEEFATSLVTRTSKGARLTPAGELVRARAVAALREVDRARQEVAWQTREASARIAVSVSPAAAMLLMPGALARMRMRWPMVLVALVDALYPRSQTMVRAGEVELAVGPLPPNGEYHDLHVQSLFVGQTTLVVRQGSSHASAQSISDLADAKWVLAGPAGGPGDPRRLSFGDRVVTAPTIVLECESYSSLLAVLPSIDAIAIVPLAFQQKYCAGVGLVNIDTAEVMPRVKLHAVWRADRPLTAPASSLLDALEQEARFLRQEVQR